MKQKIAVLFDILQLPNPAAAFPNRADVGNFPSKSKKRLRCYMYIEQLPANRNQNPYLESNYFAKFAVNTRAQNI